MISLIPLYILLTLLSTKWSYILKIVFTKGYLSARDFLVGTRP